MTDTTRPPTTIILAKEEIDSIFEEHTHQLDVALALYRIVYPDWDDIKSLDGWPKAGKEVGKYLMEKFITFDRKHHHSARISRGDIRDRGCMPGGLWLNKGFSAIDNEDVHPWDVIAAPCVYKEAT